MKNEFMPGYCAPGRSTVSTFIVVPDAMEVVAFAQHVFGAEILRGPLHYADGSLWNIEIDIGGSTIMLGDGTEGAWHRTAFVYVQVADCDATYQKAVAAGATPVMPPADQFYGARDGGVEDFAGNLWWIGTQTEDLSEAQLAERARRFEQETSAP